jgi:hypothetical protein
LNYKTSLKVNLRSVKFWGLDIAGNDTKPFNGSKGDIAIAALTKQHCEHPGLGIILSTHILKHLHEIPFFWRQ